EETYITFYNGDMDAEFEVSTELIGKVDTDNSPFNIINQSIKEADYFGGLIKKIYRAKDKAGGLQGETEVFSISVPEENVNGIQFIWFYPGMSRSALKPEIMITLTSSDYKHKKELMKIWKDMLASFQPVGR
ncbi:hypothetical protein, partial [Nocardia mangyaensis]|uniref:hypothetical protein n=1 Tax=Nocardia mangyaensis TaxID=2213200 RepID=UPI0026771CAC